MQTLWKAMFMPRFGSHRMQATCVNSVTTYIHICWTATKHVCNQEYYCLHERVAARTPIVI